MEEKSDIPAVAVVDASFILAFLLPDETFRYADNIIDACTNGKTKLFSSPILPYEVANALRSAVVQKRITQKAGEVLLVNFLRLSLTYIPVDYNELYVLALKKNTTIYDAAYLFLAQTQHIPLLTLDKTLSRLSS